MGFIFHPIGAVFGLVSLVAMIYILIAAFKESLLKGFIGLLCGLYLLWFAVFDFEDKNKWSWVGAWIICGIVSGWFSRG